ncbi:MAG: hypothetical protein LBS83_03525 [Holosporales bacterium]|jgi:hypothetical protein|nr:hypothetical protein [Holosporales bacterium]
MKIFTIFLGVMLLPLSNLQAEQAVQNEVVFVPRKTTMKQKVISGIKSASIIGISSYLIYKGTKNCNIDTMSSSELLTELFKSCITFNNSFWNKVLSLPEYIKATICCNYFF